MCRHHFSLFLILLPFITLLITLEIWSMLEKANKGSLCYVRQLYKSLESN